MRGLIEAASIPIEFLTALLGLLAVTIFFGIRNDEERRALLLIAISVYLVKAILVPIYYWVLLASGSQGFAYVDSRGYFYRASRMANEIANNMPYDNPGWKAKDPGYMVTCALMYVVFGSSTLIARFFNAAMGTFTLLYVYRIACLAFDKRVARIAVLLAGFIPFTIFMTINHRKEPVVIFLATLLYYHALRVLTKQGNWITSLPIMMIGLGAIYFFRSGFIPPFLGLFLISYLFTKGSIVTGGLVSMFVMGLLIATQFLFPESTGLDIEGNVTGRLADNARMGEFGGGLLRVTMVTSISDLWKVPIVGILMVILPFPPRWQGIERIYTLILSVSHLVFLLCLPQFVLGVREVFRADVWTKRLPLLVFSAGFLTLVGVLTAGIMRYRETVFTLVFVITAAGFKARQKFMVTGGVYAALATLAVVVYLHRFMR